MKIRFIPQRSDDSLAVSVNGSSVIINGFSFDLSPLADGQSVSFGSFSAIRESGVISVDIPLPYGVDPSIDPMQVIEVESSGVIAVPGHTATQPENITAGVIEWPSATPAPTQRELDESRYLKRGQVKDRLIAWMAADNMSRVRSGVWTVQNLVDLMADPEIKSLLELINTLSFELAMQRIPTLSNELLTPEIKSAWVEKLADQLYLVP